MKARRTIQPKAFCLAAFLLASCSTVPSMSPQEAAADISEKIAADDLKAAKERFEAIGESERHREVAFSVLYGQAQGRYEQADYTTAIRFLRFLVDSYPRATSPKEALLYALFLERARTLTKPDARAAGEFERLAAEVAKRDGGAPPWIDLIATQNAIDRGRLSLARASLARFRARWDGSPADIAAYVAELDRYLATYREDAK